jgi:hypothetical protein
MREVNRAALIVLSACFAAAGILAQEGALAVTGLSGKTVHLTSAELSRLPQQTFTASDRGSPVSFVGVLLSDVLAKVDAPVGEPFRATAASHYVVAEAKDGYRAVFAWAELDRSFTDRKIYLVTQRDGKPLSDKDGAFMTVVPDDKRASRWVRAVTALTIK